jgi:hypothetical protein
MFFKHWHVDDTEVGVVIAKAMFQRAGDGCFYGVQTPPEILFEDICEGDPATSASVSEQDIAPGKNGTDLIIRAIARSPGAKPAPDWPVGVSVVDKLHYSFRVRGPSQWRHGMFGWKLAEPEPVTEVPITYTLAYGGAVAGADESHPDVFEFNPSGIGFATSESLKNQGPFAAPQIGELAEFMSANPETAMTVHGFGPIAKSWLPRRRHAGTFDKAWQQTRHPRMPKDYSLAFWNAAPNPLQVSPPLAGNEIIQLTGISHAAEPVTIKLPEVALTLRMGGEDNRYQDMVLDTILLDVRDQAMENHTLTLLWRCMVADPEHFSVADIQQMHLEE